MPKPETAGGVSLAEAFFFLESSAAPLLIDDHEAGGVMQDLDRSILLVSLALDLIVVVRIQ